MTGPAHSSIEGVSSPPPPSEAVNITLTRNIPWPCKAVVFRCGHTTSSHWNARFPYMDVLGNGIHLCVNSRGRRSVCHKGGQQHFNKHYGVWDGLKSCVTASHTYALVATNEREEFIVTIRQQSTRWWRTSVTDAYGYGTHNVKDPKWNAFHSAWIHIGVKVWFILYYRFEFPVYSYMCHLPTDRLQWMPTLQSLTMCKWRYVRMHISSMV